MATPFVNGLGNASLASDADVISSKVRHRIRLPLTQTGNAVATTEYKFYALRAGVISSIRAMLNETIPSGDRTAVVDLQLGNASSAFATCLSATITLNSSSALRTAQSGTITTTSYSAGDILKIVVTLGGSTGTNPQGLFVSIELEDASGA